MAFGKSSSEKKKNGDVFQRGDRSEFIPYHSHYNPHTLITKNGELLQIIKIEGNFRGSGCENLDGVHASVCTTIRHVITQSNISEKFSFWVHTVRKRGAVLGNTSGTETTSAHTISSNDFAEYVSSQWEKDHRWEYDYQNEIYLTILYEGQTIPLLDTKNIKTLAFPSKNKKYCNQYFDKAYAILDNISLSILEGIRSQCSARRLTLVERVMPSSGKVARPSIFYSEPMEFLGRLINLREEKFPLPDLDLSVALQTTRLAFGFNAIEARNVDTGSRRFAAMLSVKQYVNMPVDAVDCVLQAPMELIVSQSFSFIPSDRALKDCKAQKNLFGMSGDIKSNDSFGINKMLNFDHDRPVDFVEHQINVMIPVDDLRKLDGEVGNFLNLFSKLGLITIREDILMEEAFLAQLPGNFEFVRRPNVSSAEQVAGFCRLNRFHTGSAAGNHWGGYLSLIPTNVNSPYFFNFHSQDNGHTAIFDFNTFEDRTGKILEYFLITQTRKFKARMIIFDKNQSARLLLNKLGGSYFTMRQLEKVNRDLLDDKNQRLALNPFMLPHSNYNVSFLAAWCGILVSPEFPLEENAREILRDAVEKLYSLPVTERNLPRMVALVAQNDPALSELLGKWVGHGEYSGLFDYEQDSLDAGLEMLGFDMTSAIAKPAFLLPLFSYLMHRVIDAINDQPTVIVINEAWGLLENHFFAPRLDSLLEMLRQRNVMVVFATSKTSACSGTATLSAIMARASTQIYIPDEVPVNYKSDEMGINEQDEALLLDMDRQKGDFLLKQSGESIALRVHMTELEDIVAIFTNDLKALASARGLFAGVPKDY